MSGRDHRVVATVELALAEPDWPRFRAVLAEAAAVDGWALRDCAQPHALGGSLDRQDVHVGYKQWAWAQPPEPRATLYVVAPCDGEAWRSPARDLFRRLAEAWPGGLAVREA